MKYYKTDIPKDTWRPLQCYLGISSSPKICCANSPCYIENQEGDLALWELIQELLLKQVHFETGVCKQRQEWIDSLGKAVLVERGCAWTTKGAAPHSHISKTPKCPFYRNKTGATRRHCISSSCDF